MSFDPIATPDDAPGAAQPTRARVASTSRAIWATRSSTDSKRTSPRSRSAKRTRTDRSRRLDSLGSELHADRQIRGEHDRKPFRQRQGGELHENAQIRTVERRSFKTIIDARDRIDDFIANTERLYSALGCRSLLEFENAFAQNKPK